MFFKLMIPRLIDCVVQSIKNEIVCNLLNIMKTFFGRSQLKNQTVYKKNVNINLSLSLFLIVYFLMPKCLELECVYFHRK